MNQPKQYDRDYFDRWYRSEGMGDARELARKVAMAVVVAEYHLGRPIRSVLDIGCGEAAWRAPLLKLRPKLEYLGFDSSEYAIRRYGHSRGIGYARFADFEHLRPCPPADLLVCSDVLHYIPTRELDRGLPGLAELTGGVAYLETFCSGDEPDGDRDGYLPRPAAFYRKRLAALGLAQAGSHCWLAPSLAAHAAALETLPP